MNLLNTIKIGYGVPFVRIIKLKRLNITKQIYYTLFKRQISELHTHYHITVLKKVKFEVFFLPIF